jgi:hypothetical protein
VGDPINEIIRLFEFDSIAQWQQMEEFIAQSKESKEGRSLVKELSRFIISLEEKLLISIY